MMSAREIAEHLGVTRNAVIGFADRNGLAKTPKPQRRAFDQLESLIAGDHRGCRWIEGEPVPLRPGMFCGAPVAAVGSSWCAEHSKVVWGGVPPRIIIGGEA